MSAITTAARSPYALAKDAGVADLWWPYGPAAGRYTIKSATDQTEGRMIQILIREGRGAATPLHVHREADESFYVIDGRITVFVGDERIDAGPGDYVFAPMDIPHAFVVTSERAEFLVSCAGAGVQGPLGAGIHGFFSEVAVPVVDGEEPPAPAMPDAAEFGARMAVYGIELVGPPPAV
jgi:quercetin dioxygenase-like cupin family protein